MTSTRIAQPPLLVVEMWSNTRWMFETGKHCIQMNTEVLVEEFDTISGVVILKLCRLHLVEVAGVFWCSGRGPVI
jgi:hypothetical protein